MLNSSMRTTVSLLMSALILSACASRPINLTPVELTTPQQGSVSIFSLSTRMESDDPGLVYSGERSDDITAKVATISVPLAHTPGEISFSRDGTPDLRKDFAVTSIESVDDEAAFQWFDAQEHSNKVFLFVHGFNVPYGAALYSLAQITYDLQVEAVPVLFSWPSRGSLRSYIYDKESATLSRDSLEYLLQSAIQSEEIDEITILAHSMGSWITMEALRQMAIRNGDISPKITDVILAAPDIDIDVFTAQFRAFGEQRPFVTVVISADDRALGISKVLAGDVDRLGSIDVTKEEYQLALAQADIEGFLVIDSTELKDGSGVRHSKFAESPLVLNALRNKLNAITGASSEESMSLAASILLSLRQSINEAEPAAP